jgi:hypothetical protein
MKVDFKGTVGRKKFTIFLSDYVEGQANTVQYIGACPKTTHKTSVPAVLVLRKSCLLHLTVGLSICSRENVQLTELRTQ